jgi:hypothetical protein
MTLQWNDCSQLSFGYKDGVLMATVDMKDAGHIGITVYKDRTTNNRYAKLALNSKTLEQAKKHAESLADKFL